MLPLSHLVSLLLFCFISLVLIATVDPDFCRTCGACPTCGAPPRDAVLVTPEWLPAAVAATQAAEPRHILPRLPPQMLITLFLFEAQLTGNWKQLLLPYLAILLLFCL
ncbi:unnamed protein product [Mycena citricolor]|uniref:4Fe-4S ferredoxin-type domain-containing protein n=1 Tax=Mycena citricolor TaxID=2018698 RepID=A0AAD2H9T3_9AGAR|nr:unnamed protein product [Mycena citricolor]